MEIKVTVRNKRASGDNSVIICGNSDYSVKFDLDSEWDAFSTKTMLVVCNDSTTYSVQFEGDTANLPTLYNIHDIRIGIMAGNIHTTTGAYFRCYLSIKDISGAAVEPTEDVYAQLVEALTGKITEPAEEGADGQVLTTDGKGGRSWTSVSGGGIDVTGAKVGQIVQVSSVDKNGKPTGWIPVDVPEQKQPDWNQNDTAATDYVKNRPFYTGNPVETVLVEESTVAFEDGGSVYIAEWPDSLDLIEGQTYIVKFDGTEYSCVCQIFNGSAPVIGNLSIAGAGDDSGEPFIIINQGSWMTGTSGTSASHVISISKSVQEVKKIDSKYIDFPAETDPTVPAWAKDDHKPTYTASEVGALPSDTVIPVIITYDASGNLSHTFSQIQTLISNGKTCIVLDKKNKMSYLYFGNGSNYIKFRNSNIEFSISKTGTVSITDIPMYDLPVASSTKRGGIRLGDGLEIKELDSDVVSVSDDYVNTLIDAKLGVIENGSY